MSNNYTAPIFEKELKVNELQKNRFLYLKFKLNETQSDTLLKSNENTDFRVIEKLVKEQIFKSSKKSLVESDSIKKGIEFKTQKNNLSKLKHTYQTESTLPIPVFQTKEDRNNSFGTVIHEKTEEAFSDFDKLCEKYSEPL